MQLQQLTLRELQDYVRQQEIERGFDRESSLQKCLLLGEEIGELFKAIRRSTGMFTGEHSRSYDVGEELADVLNFLFAIANRHGIDLGEAFEAKESHNAVRAWHGNE